MSSRRRPEHDPIEHGKELGNVSRNERQKSVLLCEAGRLGRRQMGDLIKSSQEIVERSKKLCAKPAPSASSGSKKRTA